MKFRLAAIAAAVCTMSLLAGCGSGAAPAASSSAPAASASARASSPAASAAASARPSAAASAAPSAAASGAASPAPSGQTPMTVSYSAVIGNVLPLWLAHDAGIFSKNGLDVNVTYINSSKGIPALISGSTQAADVGGAETLSAVAG